MLTPVRMKQKLSEVFDEIQATVLAEVIHDAYNELVKTSDFNELKAIVKDLGVAQKELVDAQKESNQRLTRIETVVAELADAQQRTEQRVAELADAQKESNQHLTRIETVVAELANAQQRTEQRVAELANAQQRTEQVVQELTKDVQGLTQQVQELTGDVHDLTGELKETRGELGGLSRSFGYALENETYRMLSGFLLERHGIELQEKLIRTEMGGKEINIFGQATRNGAPVMLVGEVKARLDERRKRDEKDVFDMLEEKVQAVRQEYKTGEIVRVLVTHFATKGILKKAQDRGIIVVQSFEW